LHGIYQFQLLTMDKNVRWEIACGDGYITD
jgi:hypothetical protein